MAYYYRGYRSGRYWSSYHRSKRSELTSLFGGINRDIEKVFLSLPEIALDALFIEYGRKYVKSSESYARRTYSKWKRGAVKLSGKTAERLLELLPPRLSKEQRFDLIRKLRKHYQHKIREHVTTSPEAWRQDVLPVINKVIGNSKGFSLPETVIKKAAWLSDGNTQVAMKILRSIEEEEAHQRTSYLEAEFKRIETFVSNVNNTDSVSHTISIPQGDIHVFIQQENPSMLKRMLGSSGRGRMGGNEKDSIPREQLQKALAMQQSRGQLLNLTLNQISESQVQELRKKILEEQIGLEVSQAKADQRFLNSSRDMASTIQAVRSLEQSSKSDYEVRSSFETASGSTNITVKKNNNTVIIVVAVVVGIILYLLLTK